MDGADVCRTSSRASRRPPDVISTAAILNPRWRRRKWRHPGPGARFSIPVVEGGGKWRPFRFRSPSWVTSFAGTGNEVTQDGDRKRKGRHFPPPSTIGIEKRETPRWTFPEITPVVNGCMLPFIGIETARRQRMSGYWAMSNKVNLSGGGLGNWGVNSRAPFY